LNGERDIAYGPHPAHRLDVYRGSAAPSSPVLVLVHGGGWSRGDKAGPGLLAGKLSHWGGLGFVVVSINYRLVPEATPIEQAADVGRALAFVQGQAPSWGADPARCVLMGHSAGAHLVSLLTADPEIARQAGARAWRCTVALDAVTDVERLMLGPHLPLHDQAWGDDRAVWRAGSPRHRLAGVLAAPLLLVCSARRPMIVQQARDFVQKARDLGGVASMLAVDLAHQELNEALGQDPRYTRDVDAFIESVGWT
jgi:arylformamidase